MYVCAERGLKVAQNLFKIILYIRQSNAFPRDVLSSNSGADEDKTLFGTTEVSTAKKLPTFRRSVIPPSSE